MNFNNINPGSVRKYLYEYVLLALVSCTVYLFLSFNSLNEFIRKELLQQRVELVKTVEHNSNTIEHNSNTINNFLHRQRDIDK